MSGTDWGVSKQVLLKNYKSNFEGLPSSEIPMRQRKYGLNEIPPDPPTPLWELVLEQFQDQLVIILLLAAVISFVLALLETDEAQKSTAFVEPLVILLILIANAVVGVVQETNAEKAIEEYTPDEAKVLRDGVAHKILSKELVPGDVIQLAVGDKIPADCRILSVLTSSFNVDQSILTGETISVVKDPDAIVKDDKAVKQDQINMLFSGTSVTYGKGEALVVKTGSETAIGEIHTSISSQIQEKTPLKIALDDFGDQLAKIISIICLLVWLINIRHFNDASHGGSWIKGAVYYFKIAVALAVAAIPEGLAVIITTCLALGTKKMAKQGAIVRKLRSVETLGCTGVICSDKTGTLTTNQMSVRRIFTMESQQSFFELQVTGSTYGPEGQILFKGKPITREKLSENKCINELATCCALCNDAKITYDENLDQFQKLGEATEAALKTLVEKIGTDDHIFNQQIPIIPDGPALAKLSKKEKLWRVSQVDDKIESNYRRAATFEFSRDRKSMSVLVQKKDLTTSPVRMTRASSGNNSSSSFDSTGSRTLYVKGAPEQILDRCSFVRFSKSSEPVALTNILKEKILAKVSEWAEEEALRVLAFATVENPKVSPKADPSMYESIESNMIFIGLVGMLDPPRPEVRSAIEKCRRAGVRVIVITGDNKKTAESICRLIGVFGEKENLAGKSYTGRELDDMSESQKLDVALHANLFSRTEPNHKQELVNILQKRGLIVAMTGDGVNDAPALKKADIGVAMGTGTDVAKLASDMVLADDNFSTIVSAVEEGRSIYANTKQFIRYLISSNIGEVVSIFLTVILGMPEALIPVQLLWVNLVTDGLPATALGFNPADRDIMKRAPRDPKEPIVTSWLFFRYAPIIKDFRYMVIGIYVGAATVFGYAWWFMFYSEGPQITYYQLSHFHSCATLFPEIGCDMFTDLPAQKGTTMSLSILVVIEMFNAMNSLSENESLFTFPLWKNLYLCLAITLSMILHLMILYVPFFSTLFSITTLNNEEWIAVILISLPVIFIDEILKLLSRNITFGRKLKSDLIIMDYWTVSHGLSIRSWNCRECRMPIYKGEEMIARDGRKIRLFYHVKCFSGSADPRTQANSSYHDSRFPNCFQFNAPAIKGHGKWSVQSYGYHPNNALASTSRKSISDPLLSKPITWGFSRSEKSNVEFIKQLKE